MARYTAGEFRQIADAFEPHGVVARIHNGIVEREIFARDIVAMLRQAADEMESEKDYEYAVEYCEFPEKWEVYKNGLTLVEAQKLSSESWGCSHRIVRRPVGKWEEVSQ